MRAERIKKGGHTHTRTHAKKQKKKTAGMLAVTRLAPGNEGKHLQAVGLKVSAFRRKAGHQPWAVWQQPQWEVELERAEQFKKRKKEKTKHMAAGKQHLPYGWWETWESGGVEFLIGGSLVLLASFFKIFKSFVKNKLQPISDPVKKGICVPCDIKKGRPTSTEMTLFITFGPFQSRVRLKCSTRN